MKIPFNNEIEIKQTKLKIKFPFYAISKEIFLLK